MRIYLVHEDVEGEHQTVLYQSSNRPHVTWRRLPRSTSWIAFCELEAHSADWKVQVCAEAGEALP